MNQYIIFEYRFYMNNMGDNCNLGTTIDEIVDVENDPVFDISSLAVDTGIPDLATEHDHYLYGVPKDGAVKYFGVAKYKI